MLQLYEKESISISFFESKRIIKISFCSIHLEMNPCQFKLFYNYLVRLEKGINAETTFIDLHLVKDSLKIELSMKDFLLLCNGVETALINEFGYKTKIPN